MLRCRLPRRHHRRREVQIGARVPHGGRLAPDPRGAAGTGAPQDPEEAGAELASCNARHTHTKFSCYYTELGYKVDPRFGELSPSGQRETGGGIHAT